MSSYPPGGDYDERLLDSAPKATRAEKQEGYNVNLLASDNSESPMNPRPTTATHDGHGSLETGVPPNKEGYISSLPPTPWYSRKRWRIALLIGAIIVIGAIVGGAVGGTVGSKNRTTTTTTTTSGPVTLTLATSLSAGAPSEPTSANGALPSASSLPAQSTGPFGAASSVVGGANHPSDTAVGNINLEDNFKPGRVMAPTATAS